MLVTATGRLRCAVAYVSDARRLRLSNNLTPAAIMRFFAFVWKNVFRRKTRSALTVIGLGVAVAAVVALVGISDSFSRQFKELYAKRGVDLVVQRVGSKTEMNNGLPGSMEDQIRKLPGVAEVNGGLMDVVSFPDHDIPNVIINGWAPGSPLFKN